MSRHGRAAARHQNRRNQQKRNAWKCREQTLSGARPNVCARSRPSRFVKLHGSSRPETTAQEPWLCDRTKPSTLPHESSSLVTRHEAEGLIESRGSRQFQPITVTQAKRCWFRMHTLKNERNHSMRIQRTALVIASAAALSACGTGTSLATGSPTSQPTGAPTVLTDTDKRVGCDTFPGDGSQLVRTAFRRVRRQPAPRRRDPRQWERCADAGKRNDHCSLAVGADHRR